MATEFLTDQNGVVQVNAPAPQIVVVTPNPLPVTIPVPAQTKPVDSLASMPATTPDVAWTLNVPAGTGTTTVTDYTVPANKYGILRHYYATINNTPAGASLAFYTLYVVRGGITTTLAVMVSLVAGQAIQFEGPNIPLRAGDVVKHVYVNNALIAVLMTLHMQIDEQPVV